MSEQRRSTLNDETKLRYPRRYNLTIYEGGNLLTVISESPLLSDSRGETFDFPLRTSSGMALKKATDFGAHLVERVAEGVCGATRVQLQLYRASVELGGIFEPATALVEMQRVIRSLCNDAWIEPVFKIQLIPLESSSSQQREAKVTVHPFGSLSHRLREQSQRNRPRR